MSRNKITHWVLLKINKGPTKIPRRLKFAQELKIVQPLLTKKWLDLGAGDGTYLSFMSDQSIGLDIKPNLQKKIRSWNFDNTVPNDLIGQIDVIWCSNLIEHVLRPHEFLLHIKKFLKPSGLLIICCPQTLLRNPFIFKGALHGDHVNFFNLTTLKLTIKFAGKGIHEVGIVAKNEGPYPIEEGAEVVKIDDRYYRPTEVDLLIGDASKAKQLLDWEPTYTLEQLIEEMIVSDIQLYQNNNHAKV